MMAKLAVGVAVLWMLVRVFVGLDPTDEMQYYGEIAALMRTGRFFQVDYFIQQLGYFLVLPLFKLHALVFAEQQYLILFGRFVMVALYVAVGAMFWRATAKRTEFRLAARIAALATLLALQPFLIFAPSYNSLGLLLVIAVACLWLQQKQEGTPPRRRLFFALLLAALTITYQPAGIALILLATIDVTLRSGLRLGVQLLGWVVALGMLLGATMLGMHGRAFFSDLAVALKFSQSFGVAATFRQTPQLVRLIEFAAVGSLLIALLLRREKWVTVATDQLNRWAYLVAPGGIGLLVYAAVRWTIGDFVTIIFFVGLLGTVSQRLRSETRLCAATIAIAGLTLGVVFSITSSNGVANFGLGAAGAIPFLLLFATAAPDLDRNFSRTTKAGPLISAFITLLILLNAFLHPYRQVYSFFELQSVANVPAFKGLWVDPVKAESIRFFSTLTKGNPLTKKRVTVIGPHPMFYFVANGEPATPMFFMFYSGSSEVHAFLAERLFQNGLADAVLITNPMPPAISAKVEGTTVGFAEKRIAVPPGFSGAHQAMTGYDFPRELRLKTRPLVPQ